MSPWGWRCHGLPGREARARLRPQSEQAVGGTQHDGEEHAADDEVEAFAVDQVDGEGLQQQEAEREQDAEEHEDRLQALGDKFGVKKLYRDYHDMLARVDDFAELGKALRDPVKHYSSGMRARLAFGLSLAIDFDALLIDEITAVGDHRFREKCQVELYEKRAHKTWVLVSHDAHYVRQHCTHACVIEKGKLQVAATVEEAIQIYEALP